MKPDKASSIFWLAFGLIIAYMSYRLKIGSLAHPGPGFLPFWSGLILGAFSVVVFLKGGITAQEEKAKRIGQLWAGMNWPKALIVTLALLAYTLTFTYLGFLLGTIALLMFFLKVVDPVRWLTAVGVAILASFISFAVFVLWLQVQLPRGIIERFLF